MLSISPDSEDDIDPEKTYAWSHGAGVSYGRLYSAPVTSELGDLVFKESKILPTSALPHGGTDITSVALTQFHLLVISKGVLYAINRFDESIVFQQDVEVRTADFWINGTVVLMRCIDNTRLKDPGYQGGSEGEDVLDIHYGYHL